MLELVAKGAAVTGGGSGVGRGIALALAAHGARVAVADVEHGRAASVADEIVGRGGHAIAVALDVRDGDAVDAFASTTVEAFGGVHVICNNAGVSTVGRQWELGLDEWRWVLDVTLTGVVHGVRSFVPRILAGGEGGHV